MKMIGKEIMSLFVQSVMIILIKFNIKLFLKNLYEGESKSDSDEQSNPDSENINTD